MSRSTHHGQVGRLLLTALLVGALAGCGTAADIGADDTSPRTGSVGAEADTGTPPAAAPRDEARSAAPTAPTSSDPAPTPSSTGKGSSPAAAAAAGRMLDPTSDGVAAAPLAAPTKVRIPAIGVDAPLEVLSVDADNILQPPVEWDAAGWYDRSPVPGQRGPAVIAGHLVGPSAPAVFVDLGALVPGDVVTVDRADGTHATFAVDRTISAERTDTFPTSEIYGPTPDAQLRLITCDGEYDPLRGHWTRNMVVFASQVAG